MSTTAGSGNSDAAVAKQQQQQLSKVEDILVKLIRLIANASISADVGEQLACTGDLLQLLIDIIGVYRVSLRMSASNSPGGSKPYSWSLYLLLKPKFETLV